MEFEVLRRLYRQATIIPVKQGKMRNKLIMQESQVIFFSEPSLSELCAKFSRIIAYESRVAAEHI